MTFPLRATHWSVWLFLGWLLLRAWEYGFEVSPLPAWTLPAFVFCVLFVFSYAIGRVLQKHHPLDIVHRAWAMGLLVGGAFIWEWGLTIYSHGWSNMWGMFTWRLGVGMGIQLVAIFLAGTWLRAHPPTTFHHISEEEGDSEGADASGNGGNLLGREQV